MNATLKLIEAKDPVLANELSIDYGFFTSKAQIEKLATLLPKVQLLVRCGAGRFVTSADTANWFSEIVTKEGTDYVRDISLLAN